MANYEVIVGNIGKVYEGGFYQSALDNFTVYRDRSVKGIGKAAGEPVTLMEDGEPIKEYQPEPAEEPEPAEQAKPEPINARLLETLRALTDWARENTSPRDANSPHSLLIDSVKVIDEADKLKGEATRVDLDTEPMTDLSQLISSLQGIQRMGAKIITKADALAYVNANSFAYADRPRPAGVPFNCNPKEN